MLKNLLITTALLLPLAAQTKEFDIPASSNWVDTGIDLQPGDTLKFTATGQIQYAGARGASDPNGMSRGWSDLIRQLPVNEAGRGALVGRIGSSAAARAFLIGTQREARAPIAGRLFLGVNQGAIDNGSGGYHVKVDRTAAPVPATPAAPVVVPPFPQAQLDSIPRRVNDAEGAPGDRTNFIIVGSQDKVQTAFKNAGWVTVDRSKKDALMRGVFATLSKEAYVTLPMSELQLFGRSQDFGYAQGDPVRVVASRHHFRIWKAPFDLQGQTVWVGAGTHDIGFDRDQRNNGITHKIDPDVDGERDYIRDSLLQTGLVVKTDYMTPADPITTARTAHGEEFHSDGRTLLVYLAPDAPASASSLNFGDYFCSVLKQNNPGGGEWGPCARYIESAGKEDMKLGPLPAQYRIVIVPGIMSSCVSDSPAFLEGQEALKKQGVDVSLLQVPNDSSESNAKMIADYLNSKAGGDPRKFILIGYSKGGPDIQTALAQQKGVADLVAAFVAVAGASGGSPVADVLPPQADRYLGSVPLQSCKGDLSQGFKSLKRSARQQFLATYPHPFVPTYSLPAKSDKANTSKALAQTWQILSTYGSAQDGQLLREDAIVPESKVLGAALADHFAVALPFDKSTDPAVKSGMDKALYPRAALLESLLRFVADDLGKK